MESVPIEVHQRIRDIPAGEWDACAGADNPFVSHAFLDALERSGSVTAEEGWAPVHLAVRLEGKLVAAAPLYLKAHSYGEYVFDWGWAEAYERAGGRYYPKLQACVPFTPVTGPRLLVHPSADRDAMTRLLVVAMLELCKQHEASGLHLTFLTEREQAVCAELGLLPRRGLQYHWHNDGYGCFDDFLGALSHGKRKSIRRERRDAAGCGARVTVLTGAAIEPRHWDAFYRFYRGTIGRKWAQAYLTRSFFHRLGEAMADRVVLVMAESGGELVAGALNLLGTDALYGRYWGCLGDYRFLHFECCYYRAIDFAIERGLERVEAGAQGAHKVQRGYLPEHTYSAHWLADRGFSSAIDGFLRRERLMLEQERGALTERSPFKRAPALAEPPRSK